MSHQYITAMIGCGNRGRKHALGLAAENRCKVTALVDILPEAAESLNRDFNFSAKIYHDYRKMLAETKPEIVVICLWTAMHLPVVRDCAFAGVKAILCEKPMAVTWGECAGYEEIVGATGCQLTFGHQRRFAEGNQLVRKWISQGLFGDILRMDLYSPPHLLDCGTHTFDQALSFNQEIPARWVIGAIDTRSSVCYFDVPAEGMASGALVFTNGVRASIQVGGPDMDMWSGVRLTGSKGFIEVFWDGDFGRGRLYDNPKWSAPLTDSGDERQMTALVADAVNSLEKGQEPELSYKKSLRAAEIIFAFYQSVRRNERVDLPLKDMDDNPLHSMINSGRIILPAAHRKSK